MSSMVIKKVWQPLKPHSDCSDKKRTPDFFGDIQAMIDYDPSMSIRSITRDTSGNKTLHYAVIS